MKKLIRVILLASLLICTMVGCDAASQTEPVSSTTESNPVQEFIEKQEQKEEERKQKEVFEYVRRCGADVNEYRDKETGVHYFILSEVYSYGGMGGICPRYNADGSLYVD